MPAPTLFLRRPWRAATLAAAMFTLAACPASCRSKPAQSSGVATATVAQILGAASYVGQQVLVTGTCIGYSTVMATGPQPRSRSDWQLAQGDAAIWVVGPYPTGCSGSSPATAPGTYLMTVAQDTIPALGNQGRQPRQYLVYAGEPRP